MITMVRAPQREERDMKTIALIGGMSWESTVVYYQLLNRMARALERGGVECLLICTNTMHKIAPQVQQAVDIPLLHIADATAAAVKTGEVMKPLLLATCYTMEQDFYTGRLRDTHGIDGRVPDDVGRTTVHDIIYEELCQGIIEPGSKQAYEAVVARAQADESVDGVIFGCREVGLLVRPEDFSLPGFDTTEIHAKAAMDFALS